MEIDILIGDNLYGTALHFSKALAHALKSQGVKTRLFWIGEGHFFHAFYEILSTPPDMTLSFCDIALENRPLGDLWQIPHLFWMVDPPIYFLHSLKSQYGGVCCVDEKDCAFVRELNFPHVFFLPHAADIDHRTPIHKNREHEAVFFGTCVDYESVANRWSSDERDLLWAASEKVLTTPHLSIVEALLTLNVNGENLPRYHGEVDLYARGRERVELIRSIEGEKVKIWGEGPWKKYFPAHEVYPSLKFEETLEVMKNSRVVLNSSPRFKAGAHERIFYALMCGSAVYTAENPFIKTHLPELLTYHCGEWNPPDFSNWHLCAEAGQQRVLEEHTWNARARSLISYISIERSS